ncbi:MAG: tetratricopeptide repeat protein, partial [Pseudonocardiaceae bacterium]
VQADPLDTSIRRAQERLREHPDDALTWAQLGGAYVERARISASPGYYSHAQGALDRSMRLQPEGNAEAMIGLGALANSRHDFTAARDWAQRAIQLRPATAAGYGVLADALTQLGDTEGATAAIQQMLDLRPGIAAFTRASYDLELHGRVVDARRALEQALVDAHSPADIAFCRYYLGELAFNSGDLDGAARQYEQGLVAAPDDAALLAGTARIDAAQGRTTEALESYRDVTARLPLPQYLQEYGELLTVVGRTEQAQRQFDLYRTQQELYQAQGASDDLAVALFLADHGDPAQALGFAEAEWARRQNVFTADAMAWALHVAGRDEEALGFADRAATLGWRNATLTYHRGMILRQLGRADEARTALRDALAINPYFSPLHAPRAAQALAALR